MRTWLQYHSPLAPAERAPCQPLMPMQSPPLPPTLHAARAKWFDGLMDRLVEPRWPTGDVSSSGKQAAVAKGAGHAAEAGAGSGPRLSLTPRFRYSSRPAEEDC